MNSSPSDVRDWTLYVIKFTDGTYYIGITSYHDVMKRISQHGGPLGARWSHNKTLEEVVETRRLGHITRLKAENIENDVTLEYRKKYGGAIVRGGYNANVQYSLIPNFTPGSMQMAMFILACLAIALILVLFIAKF